MNTLRENTNHNCDKAETTNHANKHSLCPPKSRLHCCHPISASLSSLMSTLTIFCVFTVFVISFANSRADAFCFPALVPLSTSLGTAKTAEATATAIFSTESTEQQEGAGISTPNEVAYKIRDCQYRELTSVASLVVESFYDKKKVNLVARKLYQLAETNRLQQNFPYPESRGVHRMLVMEAIGGDNNNKGRLPDGTNDEEPTIVGFCDVDCRPCATKTKLPRPYLSDLAIDPKHRRRGLARRLIEASEEFVRSGSDKSSNSNSNNNKDPKQPPFDELWIRVASDNDAALGLYKDKLGYSLAEWSTGEEGNSGDQPEIFTLRKDFRK